MSTIYRFAHWQYWFVYVNSFSFFDVDWNVSVLGYGSLFYNLIHNTRNILLLDLVG